MSIKIKIQQFKKSFLALSKSQKKYIFIAFVIAIGIKFIPLSNYVSQTFSLMFHELGHAVTAWSFGHFAVPRFDMLNGGGVTDIYNRSVFMSIVIFVFILANYLIIKNQSDKYTIKKTWFWLIIYFILFFTEWRFSLISFMGKGGELFFCFLLGWYALYHLRIKPNPKPLFYLCLSVMLWINSIEDSFQLLFNDVEKSKYISGIKQTLGGDPFTNDLVKLSDRSGLSIDFFNYILLFFSIYTLFKMITYAHYPAYSKARFFKYLRLLSSTLKNQVISTINSNNKKLKGGRHEKIRRNKTARRKHQSKRD